MAITVWVRLLHIYFFLSVPAQGSVSVGGGNTGVSSGVILKGQFWGLSKGSVFNMLVNFVKQIFQSLCKRDNCFLPSNQDI